MKAILPFMTLTFAGLIVADHVVKRSDDVNPLEAVVSKLSQDVVALVARVAALENSAQQRVAFLGQLQGGGETRPTIPQNTPIHFMEVFDIGDGFDQLTGIYTAKYPGVYVINFQLLPLSAASFLIDLKMNGNTLVRARTTDDSNVSPSCSSGVSARARAGDRFWLETTAESSDWEGFHTFLSIALIIPGV